MADLVPPMAPLAPLLPAINKELLGRLILATKRTAILGQLAVREAGDDDALGRTLGRTLRHALHELK